MLSQVATLYGARMPSLTALSANELPRSTTSGARSWPLREVIALISSWLAPSGFSSSILMPYFASNASMMLP